MKNSKKATLKKYAKQLASSSLVTIDEEGMTLLEAQELITLSGVKEQVEIGKLPHGVSYLAVYS